MQQKTAKLNKISLFIEMCDQYSIAFDIIWGLSFNQDIQQQLRASTSFMSKLAHLSKESIDEQMKTIIHGILWNLEINHKDHPTSEKNGEKTFDIMISYSHKEKFSVNNFMKNSVKQVIVFGLILIKCMETLWMQWHKPSNNHILLLFV
jgi:hypothetical protein